PSQVRRWDYNREVTAVEGKMEGGAACHQSQTPLQSLTQHEMRTVWTAYGEEIWHMMPARFDSQWESSQSPTWPLPPRRAMTTGCSVLIVQRCWRLWPNRGSWPIWKSTWPIPGKRAALSMCSILSLL